MKASELRIGNIVSLYGSEATIIPNDFEKWFQYEQNWENKAFKPIPLTEEKLLEFGFKKDSDGILVIMNCMYWLDTGILQLAMGYAPLINAPCKYVHQLQNLWFALTGEELTIK